MASAELRILDPEEVRRCLRDIVALSTLPAVWTGVDPLRIAESLAASLFATLEPEFIYVRFNGDGEHPPLDVVQTDRHHTTTLPETTRREMLEWARNHDPDELLELPRPDGQALLNISVRTLGSNGELGLLAAAFSHERHPSEAHRLAMNVGASQATIALANAHLMRSLRQSEERDRQANEALAARLQDLERMNVDLQRTRRAALESERRLATLVSNLPGMAYRCRNDQDLTMEFISDGVRAVTGYEPADFTSGRVRWPDLWHPEDIPWTDQVVHDALRQGRSFELEYRIGRRDGSFRWVWEKGVGIFEDGPEPVAFEGFVSDITDRKYAEEALRESEERFREMADNAPVMAWVTDANGCCTFLSKRWYEFTGQTPAASSRPGWVDEVHPDDRDQVRRALEHANARREPFHLECRLRRRDGEYRWAIGSAVPRIAAGGEFLGHIGSVIDITERREAEDALRASAKALWEADRLKDEFLATLSHELRTPLTSILGWSQMINSSDIADPEVREGLDAISRAARIQSQLIEDVLDVSRIVSGKMRLERRPTRLAEVIEAAVETVTPAAEAKSIELLHSVDSGVGIVAVDPARIQQVVWNLLSNAIKFTPAGGNVRLRVERAGDEVVIEVSDDGPGIPEEFLPHIFERFRQADSTSRRLHAGLGLGLALTKDLTELHGGRVSVDSEGGKGAVFTVIIPAPSELRQKSSPRAVREEPRNAVALSGVRIIFVDDDEDARTMFGLMLRKQGADAVVVPSVAEALSMLDAFNPDVVVTDVAMPERNGYDLLEEIRSRARYEHLPVLALTAHGRRPSTQSPSARTFSRYLTKPIDEKVFIDVIARAAASRQL